MISRKKFTIFGNPVEHSKSPLMHNAGFKFINFDAIYTKTLLEDGTQIKKVFLENNFSGANITVPHKEIAYQKADKVIGMANKIKAVNTYIDNNGTIEAYNTDGVGFLRAINEFKDIQKVLILGAGGTTRAISVAFLENGIVPTIVNRSKNKLDFFENLGCKTAHWDNFCVDSFDLIINATSAGLNDTNYPISQDILKQLFQQSKYAVDCIYGKMTPFLSLAQQYNLTYKDGKDMLLYQGIVAFELFTKTKATNELIDIMKNALDSN